MAAWLLSTLRWAGRIAMLLSLGAKLITSLWVFRAHWRGKVTALALDVSVGRPSVWYKLLLPFVCSSVYTAPMSPMGKAVSTLSAFRSLSTCFLVGHAHAIRAYLRWKFIHLCLLVLCDSTLHNNRWLFSFLTFQAGPAKGEGTVFIHIHTFLLPTGCRPAAPGLPFTGPATRVCEVYFRVCLFPVSAHRPSGFICPPTSYTTQRFRHSRPDQQLSLSTSQPAHLPFKGAAQVSIPRTHILLSYRTTDRDVLALMFYFVKTILLFIREQRSSTCQLGGSKSRLLDSGLGTSVTAFSELPAADSVIA